MMNTNHDSSSGLLWGCVGAVAMAIALLAMVQTSTAQLSVATNVATNVLYIGTLEPLLLNDSSGLTASIKYPGIFWTHNGGESRELFAIDRTGQEIRSYGLTASFVDWEDIAADRAGNLYLADIGADGISRTRVVVRRIQEPNPYVNRFIRPAVNRSWYLRFPERIRPDCESFFLRGNYGYIVSKTRTTDGKATIYRFSLLDSSETIPLQVVTRVNVAGAVTAASLTPDGERLALLTRRGAYMLRINGNIGSAATAPRRFTRFDYPAMSGCTFIRSGLLVTADSREVFLFNHSGFKSQ
jgi:hypothetical protein